MRFFLAIAAFCLVTLTGCIKDDKGCTNVKPADEEAQMLAFAASNGITATRHSSGLYYEVITEGSGATPTSKSTVTVNYTGKYLSGTQFDKSSTPISFRLNGVIEGWTIGLQLIKKGGKIKLIVPSSLGYGCNGNSPIPPNTILYFDVELVDVK